MIKLLQVEYEEVYNPDWQTIEKYIRLLDGKINCAVWLFTEEEPNGDEFFIIIGGLNGMYFCQYFDGEEYWQVNLSYKDDDSIVYYYEDGQQDQLKRNCISLEQAIAATQHYFEKGTILGFPNWEERYSQRIII